jgi:GxxExxY protein
MELLYEDLSERIIGCLIRVHEELGPALPENTYQAATALEMSASGLVFLREPEFLIRYRDVVIGHHRPDFIVDGKIVLELKSVTRLDEVFRAQVLTYLRVTKLRVGLLINFNVPVLKAGIKRISL